MRLNCSGPLHADFFSINTCTVFDSLLGVHRYEGPIVCIDLHHFIRGLSIHGFWYPRGPGNNTLQIPSIGGLELCTRFQLCGFGAPALVLFKGWRCHVYYTLKGFNCNSTLLPSNYYLKIGILSSIAKWQKTAGSLTSLPRFETEL